MAIPFPFLHARAFSCHRYSSGSPSGANASPPHRPKPFQNHFKIIAALLLLPLPLLYCYCYCRRSRCITKPLSMMRANSSRNAKRGTQGRRHAASVKDIHPLSYSVLFIFIVSVCINHPTSGPMYTLNPPLTECGNQRRSQRTQTHSQKADGIRVYQYNYMGVQQV